MNSSLALCRHALFLIAIPFVLGTAQQAAAQSGVVARELFLKLSATDNTYATTVGFTNLPASQSSTLPEFDSPSNSGDGFGERLRAFVIPPSSGLYTFSIASDEWSDLFLSSDESPTNRVRIAYVNNATRYRDFSAEPNQQSAPVALVAGQRYYIEAVRKEGSGPDHLTVRWQLPDGSLEEPISGKIGNTVRLVGYRTNSISAPALLNPVPTNVVTFEGRPILLTAAANNSSPVSYQWLLGGVEIPGAIQSTFTIPAAQVSPNHGQIYRCRLSNTKATNLTAEIRLTVQADTVAPALSQVVYVGPSRVRIRFSEAVTEASALDISHYQLDSGATLSKAVMIDDATVELVTSALTLGQTYTVQVSGIQDRIKTPNTLSPAASVSFKVTPFQAADVGGAVISGSIDAVPGGYDIAGASRDIGGSADQFQYNWQLIRGDFDFQVRVQSLSQSFDAWSKAGLMARSTLSSNSAYAMAVASPGVEGCYMALRSATGGTTTQMGSYPANYPDTWLRLSRQNNAFNAYASRDGQSWTRLGSSTLAMPSEIYLGMALAGHVTNQVVKAQFRDFGAAGGSTVSERISRVEPPGPSSRTTPLAITEIMFQSTLRPDLTNSLEFIELYNSNPYFEDLSGYHFEGDIHFAFPQGMLLQGGAYVVLARDPAALKQVYGITNVLGPFTGALKSAGNVRLEDRLNAVMLQVPYENKAPWPVGANGTGHSLVLARPSYGEKFAQAWDISDRKGGSPGRADSVGAEPLRDVVINEFLANSLSPETDYVELYNRGTRSVDLGGAWLSDSPSTNRFQIPQGTRISAGGFVVFRQDQLGFSLNAEGETLYLVNAAQSRVIDAVQYGDQRSNISLGRVPDGADQWYPQKSLTPGAAGSGSLQSPVVINEILYKPLSGDNEDGFVELYNAGTETVDLAGWKFVAGPSYTFPAGAKIPAGGYVVVARNRTRLLSRYSGTLNEQNTFGNYSGKPTTDANRIALAMPVSHVNTDAAGIARTNTLHPIVDEVTFGLGGRWGRWANGDGSSLELRDPRGDHRQAYNWGDSDETRKAPWTTVEATGLVNLGAPLDGTVNRLELTLLNAGECLVDNVEVLVSGTAGNRVLNPTFESGLSPWVPQGNHVNSFLDSSEGFGSSNSLHVRASARGDTGANRIRVALNGAINDGQTCTIRAKVRWLRGWPELVLRLEGNGFELAGVMQTPPNPGTPGAKNSIAVDNAPPAISEVHHSPVLPAVNEDVLVTARVHDPDGVASLTLRYHLDPDTTYRSVAMRDDGQGGDAVAGDGIYTATVPGQSPNTLVGFYVEATDAAANPKSSRFPLTAPDDEALVRFGEPTPVSGYATYHYHMTAKKVDLWINRPSLSNERVEGTFVYGNFRAIYGIAGKYSGSPYHQGFGSPVTDPCHYSLDIPLDDLLLGTENFNKLHSPGNGPFDDDSLQREQTAYWVMRQMNLPYNYRRYIAMYVNGNRKGSFMEDTQTPGSDVLDQRFPNDSNGNLYKLQPWFEFDDVQVTGGNSASFNNVSWCTLLNFYSNPQQTEKKLARYRYNFLTRAANGTANDYTNVWDLTDAANTLPGGDYVGNMKRLVDMEEWLRIFAVQHSVGNWDSFGNRNAQNMYGYKPQNGRWTLMTWDFNIVLGNSGSDGPTGDDLFQYNASDDAMLRIYKTPEFRRSYWRALKEIAEGPMNNPALSALLDAKYAEMVASGFGSVANPSGIKSWISQRRDYLLSSVRPYITNFTVLGSADYETNSSVAVIVGSAPLEVDAFVVNGVSYPVTWFNPPGSKEINVTSWRIQVPLTPGANTLVIQGLDRNGNPMAGIARTNLVRRSGDLVLPQGRVLFTEIQYNGARPGSSFIELYNSSTTETFDLTGWRLDGVSYTFPEASSISPGQYLVLAGDATQFARAYGTGVPVFDSFKGTLSNEGEVLSLIKPGATPADDVVVDRVRYESAAPWSARANGTGASLQLKDVTTDNSRAGSWGDAGAVEWQKVSVTATNKGGRLLLFLPIPGDLYIDDVSLTDASGNDVVKNGGFESPLSGTWFVSTNCQDSAVTSGVAHSGNSSLHLVARVPSNSVTNQSVWQDTLPVQTNGVYTLSFWYLPSTNAFKMAARTLPNSSLAVTNAAMPNFATPGGENNIRQSVPAYPTVWLNEVLPYNRTGLADEQGDRDSWVELYNPGLVAVDLGGLYLSDNYTNLTQWAFPQGTLIAPGGYLLVWVDGEPESSTPTSLHTSFALSLTNGAIVLSRTVQGQPQVVDYLNFPRMDADRSFGSYPDGQPFYRQRFFKVTPRAGNDGTPPPVRINEWMADNGSVIANPVGGKFSDWFELYNPGEQSADLSGYYLSESAANPNQFLIPSGTVIPAHGYQLVWADKQSAANTAGQGDLHVNFALDKKNGGVIALYSPSLALVDQVSFGKQTNNVSMGRFPDGSDFIRFLVRPTPRAANVLGLEGNTPPKLAPIPNRTMAEGSRLVFTATAEDAESSLDQLTFSLAPGAPAGAVILPDGRFRWRPTEAQGPNDYSITVVVTDSGNPPLSDSVTFRVSVSEVNAPPVFDTRPHYTKVGQTLRFATATDSDIPAQQLGFGLPLGAPAGLTIDPATGVVTWTPTEQQVGHYTVAVQAVDNGVPPMSALFKYSIDVLAANETLIVGEIVRTGASVVIRCQATVGKHYQLFFTESLSQPLWQAQSGSLTATSPQVEFTDSTAAAPRRYYRILQTD